MKTITFTEDQYDSVCYAAREAQIRFSRLRTQILADVPEMAHWTIEKVDEKIEHYKEIEDFLRSFE
jgi:hypothetical protein